MRRPIFALAVVLASLLVLGRASAATGDVLTVDRTDDVASAMQCTPAPSDCSLRGAVLYGNSHEGAETIDLQPGEYLLSIVGRDEDDGMTGDLDIKSDLNIRGDVDFSVVDAARLDRAFHIPGEHQAAHYNVQINGITIMNGEVAGTGGAILNSFSSLSLTDALIVANSATPSGSGGAIYNVGSGAVLDVTRTTIFKNSAASDGGGIVNNTGTLNVYESTINVNSANEGGGITNSGGIVNARNSTISGNFARGDGGGILTNNDLNLTHVTVASNVANSDADSFGDGGGIYYDGGDEVTIRNSILAGNAVPGGGVNSDCRGTMFVEGENIIGTPSLDCAIDGTGNVAFTNPNLGMLAANGGYSETHLPNPGSPAIDAIPVNQCPPPFIDQRGFGRPAGNGCDIGAVEAESIVASQLNLIWGDNLCDGAVNMADVLEPLKSKGELPVDTSNVECPHAGDSVYISPPNLPTFWGDNNCDGRVDGLDTLALLTHLASLEPLPVFACPLVGDEVNITLVVS